MTLQTGRVVITAVPKQRLQTETYKFSKLLQNSNIN